jgi:hypothetical protein
MTTTVPKETPESELDAYMRGLDDRQWQRHFDAMAQQKLDGYSSVPARTREVMRALDRIAGELAECERDTLAVMCGDLDARQWHHSAQFAAASALKGSGLAELDGHTYRATPRGRAVLARTEGRR